MGNVRWISEQKSSRLSHLGFVHHDEESTVCEFTLTTLAVSSRFMDLIDSLLKRCIIVMESNRAWEARREAIVQAIETQLSPHVKDVRTVERP